MISIDLLRKVIISKVIISIVAKNAFTFLSALKSEETAVPIPSQINGNRLTKRYVG